MKKGRAAGPAIFGCILTSALACAQEQAELDDGRQWLESEARPTEDAPPLVRAAAAAALNDSAEAERLLRSVIRAEPKADGANRAYELLSRIYLRSGQYARLIQNLDAWANDFPDRPQVSEEQADVELFRGLPDQINGSRRLLRLVHEGGDDFSIPLSINGQAATYLVDTGAWVSVMTEADALRLDVIPTTSRGTIGDASGSGASARTAVAREVTIGAMQFQDVSFIVLPGDESGGIVGMPILLALGRVHWSNDGGWQLVEGSEPRPNENANLVFYENKLLLSTEVLAKRVFGTLDTGAVTTDLNSNFAATFAELVEQTGTKQTNDITGLGGTTRFEAVLLPEVRFVISGAEPALSPALVTLQTLPSMGGECCVGNIGRDLLTQSGGFTIDFSSMTLWLD